MMKLSFLACLLTSTYGLVVPQAVQRPSTKLHAENTRRAFVGAVAAGLLIGEPVVAMEAEDFSNDFIQTLKAKSDAKRDEYTKQVDDGNVSWKKMTTSKFSQQYSRPSYVGVQRKDGTFEMMLPDQRDSLKKEGKIVEEYIMRMDKKKKVEVPDYSKGTIFKYIE